MKQGNVTQRCTAQSARDHAESVHKITATVGGDNTKLFLVGGDAKQICEYHQRAIGTIMFARRVKADFGL